MTKTILPRICETCTCYHMDEFCGLLGTYVNPKGVCDEYHMADYGEDYEVEMK